MMSTPSLIQPSRPGRGGHKQKETDSKRSLKQRAALIKEYAAAAAPMHTISTFFALAPELLGSEKKK